MQEANKKRYEEKRLAKEQNIGSETAIVDNKIKENKKTMSKVKKQIEEVESDEEPEVQIIKKQKKKKKPRIIVEDDSSDSEQEIVISRRKRNKKPVVADKPTPTQPIDIPDRDEKKEETAPIEKEKKEKKVPELKEYTHLQILKGLGL